MSHSRLLGFSNSWRQEHEEYEPEGRMTRLRSRTLEGRGEIRLEDGTVAVEAKGVYILLPQEEIEQVGEELEFWKVVPD